MQKAVGCNLTLKSFVRFETGEGLEKKEEDFAARSCRSDGQLILIILLNDKASLLIENIGNDVFCFL